MKVGRSIFFLVPKPRLPVTGDGPKPGLRAQMRSQAGAWERGKKKKETIS